MTDFAFKVESFERTPTVGALSDVVTTVHYRMLAQDSDFHADTYGAVSISDPDPASFVSFDGINENSPEPKAWVFDALAENANAGRDENSEGDAATADSVEADMQAGLQAQIDELKNPTSLFGLPKSYHVDG